MVDVLYSDNHLLALKKPAGLLTQPSGTERDSLEAQAKAWIKETMQKPGNVYLHAVHRLDTPVSGIVLFARTSKALSRLQEQMRQQKFKKVYEALVSPIPSIRQGHLRHWLIHREHWSEVVPYQQLDAKLAELDYKVVKEMDDKALLEVTLKTGRYHQIRAQLAAIGSPIVGDERYGSKEIFHPGTIALHHSLLEFVHPVTDEVIQIVA